MTKSKAELTFSQWYIYFSSFVIPFTEEINMATPLVPKKPAAPIIPEKKPDRPPEPRKDPPMEQPTSPPPEEDPVKDSPPEIEPPKIEPPVQEPMDPLATS